MDKLLTKHDEFYRDKTTSILTDLYKVAKFDLAKENSALLSIGIKMLALIHAQGTEIAGSSSSEISNRIVPYFRSKLDGVADPHKRATL